MITENILQDIKNSAMAVGGSRLRDCLLCTNSKATLYKNNISKVIKCPHCTDYLAIFVFHYDQTLNFPYLIYKSHEIASKYFGRRFMLDFSNGEFEETKHLYIHIRRRHEGTGII